MDASLLWLIPALPLFGAILNGSLSLAGAKDSYGPPRGLVATFAVLMPAISFALAVAAASRLGSLGGEAMPPLRAELFTWFAGAGLDLPFSLTIDRLSSLMLLFVTGIGTLIHLYSVGYMQEDRGFARFMAYLNLFMAAMITLIMGSSLPVTFLGWEGVGLCSYLLIGFWHKTPEYADAARKAFIYNRVGDLGFLLGGFALFHVTGSLDYAAISAWFQSADAAALADKRVWIDAGLVLIFLGCAGKSAQIPLQAWLPDAMAGPTPVSALIHAATMVTAGVYLVARLSDAYVVSSTAMTVVFTIGCATAVWGAVAGLVQNDVKKALAYSTVSQLGFMFMAAGAGAFDVAIFHVFTHAFFKAALFLSAGAVIHGLHHEQDMRRMGGLRKQLPVAYLAMFYGWWAITGLPFAAAFFSKDLILESAFAGHVHLFHANIAPIVGGIALATAGLTAVYMTRVITLVFWSPSRVDPEVKHHIHGTPMTMAIPLIILGIGSLVAGFAWVGLPLGWLGVPDGGMAFLQGWLAPVVGAAQAKLAAAATAAGVVHGDHHALAWTVAGVGTLVAGFGSFLGYWLWRNGPKEVPAAGTSTAPTGFGGGWTFGFDKAADWLVVKPVTVVAFGIYWVVELAILGVAGWLTGAGARALGDGYAFALQRSRLRTSLALAMLGLAAAIAALIMVGS
ncbi:MAG: NADH-quinone oxidoreductase subunit L [Planctomycetes bacterium]|nr:NADH-quinone oxidoreductase subunit L [Planctomycetota bacterium]